MSVNCIKCVKNRRTGLDLLCDECRDVPTIFLDDRHVPLTEAMALMEDTDWLDANACRATTSDLRDAIKWLMERMPIAPAGTTVITRDGSAGESVALPNGCALYWKDNGVGGRTYSSDEVGGGVQVWDTSLVAMSTLLAAVAQEMAFDYREKVGLRKASAPSAGAGEGGRE